MQPLERLFTTRLLSVMALAVLAAVLGLLVAVRVGGLSLEDTANVTDIGVKVIAGVVGMGWALNRYFVTRQDYPHLRVDLVSDVVPAAAFSTTGAHGLLVFRLDVVNTSQVVLRPRGIAVAVSALDLRDGKVVYDDVFRWPDTGLHPAGPIEPGSWTAVNHAVPILASCAAVRLFLEIELDEARRWTWHRTIPTRLRSESQCVAHNAQGQVESLSPRPGV